VLTADGVVVSGIVREETESELTLITPEGTLITIATDDIDDRSIGLSGMPADFPNYLSRREIRDLVAYLSTLREPPPNSH
jgi:quinoprotein glucose dehydrogenase